MKFTASHRQWEEKGVTGYPRLHPASPNHRPAGGSERAHLSERPTHLPVALCAGRAPPPDDPARGRGRRTQIRADLGKPPRAPGSAPPTPVGRPSAPRGRGGRPRGAPRATTQAERGTESGVGAGREPAGARLAEAAPEYLQNAAARGFPTLRLGTSFHTTLLLEYTSSTAVRERARAQTDHTSCSSKKYNPFRMLIFFSFITLSESQKNYKERTQSP